MWDRASARSPVGSHYDPSAKVLRLSSDVYDARSMAALASRAMRQGMRFRTLSVRTAGDPQFGGSRSGLSVRGPAAYAADAGDCDAVATGSLARYRLFSLVVFFQLINLPVEFDASARAKKQLVALGMIADNDSYYVSKVLNAAALTYVAATLQSVMTLLWYILQALSGRRSDELMKS